MKVEAILPESRSMKAAILPTLLAVLLSGSIAARAVEPWPAETNTAAAPLTGIDAGLNAVNWSGASWNPQTRTLWLACNSGYFWALVENGAGSFRVATNAAGTKAKWSPGGDFEGICQTDSNTNLVYVMDENGYIREYDVSRYDVTNATHVWDVRTQCPEVGGASGGEGIAFIPNDYLRRQKFCHTNGSLCVSTNGMGGLMFVGYQNDGEVYVFDLNRGNNTYAFVGHYKTGRAETADLEFDRASGELYVWHNPANINYLEVVELNSAVDGTGRRLRQLVEYNGPRTGNLEGFAVVPSAATNDSGGCIVTDDDNQNGEAVVWYRQFQPIADTDADGLADSVELWHFGTTTQTVGSADYDLDGLANADEIIAGTDPTNDASVLVQYAATADTEKLVLSWQSVTGRTYAIQSTAILTNGFTNTVLSAISADHPLNVSTVDVSDLSGLTFYRIAIEVP
jgi:WD40 repeat protein